MFGEPSVFHDIPVRVLFCGLLGLATLELALVTRAVRHPRVVRQSTLVAPTPLPTPPSGFRMLTLGDARAHGWSVEEEGGTRRFTLRAGGTVEQKALSPQPSRTPGEFAAEEDDRLAHWGPEYQRLRLDTLGSLARLEYSLNLPNEPTTRTVVLVGRVRRQLITLTITAPEERFPEALRELEPLGLPLHSDRP